MAASASVVSRTLVQRLAASLPAPVELRETHAAWVLLSGGRALKLRKPVRYAFLDYSTPERRLAASLEEVRVNETLAPGLYRGVRALCEREGRIELGPVDGNAVLDYVVEMRRFDERDTMAALCEQGRLRVEQIEAIAVLLARFHAGAEHCDGGAGAFSARARADAREVIALAGPLPDLERFAEAALARNAAQLDARAGAGRCRDGHGDLRAEHVVFEQPPLVVDRIEFDPALRRADVGSDIAFLAMDLEARGCGWAAEQLLAAYARAGGDPGDARLRALFAWQRALVRAKVALLRDDAAAATKLLALAERYAWRERIADVVLVTGPPASGKSTLARALAHLSGLPLLGSDATRKTLIGATPTTRLRSDAYRDEVTHAVYRALGYRAALARAQHGGAIVDATCRSSALRRTLIEHLGDIGHVTALVCETPAKLRLERAEARMADPARVSDADPEVARLLAARFESPTPGERGLDRVLALDCSTSPAAILADLAAQLDALPEATT
jgi:aminoglycoside phosphotransferase family enzyme/predicted kinase